MSTAIRNIPKNEADLIKRTLSGTLRGRGPRKPFYEKLGGRAKSWQSIPKEYAQRFTLYDNYSYPRTYFDYVGIDDNKIRIRYNQAKESQR